MSNEINLESKFEQANELIKATHQMDDHALKLFFIALAMREIGELEVKISMSDLLKVVTPDRKYSVKDERLYTKTIEDAVRSSVITVNMPASRLSDDQLFEWIAQGNKETDMIEISGAIFSAKRNMRTNIVHITFNPDFIPMLDELQERFTWVYLSQVLRLTGKYSPRIYEWCRMHLTNKKRQTFVWWLNSESEKAPGIRQFLNLEDGKYTAWNDVKKRIIDPSFNEITEKCDMNVSYSPVKKGSSVAAIDVQMIAKKPSLKKPKPKKTEKTTKKKTTRKTTSTSKAKLPDYYGIKPTMPEDMTPDQRAEHDKQIAEIERMLGKKPGER